MSLPNMSLPNFSRLSVQATLFEHLAKKGVGKDRCNRHKEPIVTDDDIVENCAIEGYLMYKEVDDSEVSPKSYDGKFINVNVGGSEFQLLPNKKRSNPWSDKLEQFELLHKDWINRVFPMVCYRGEGLLSVQWTSYSKELMKLTEWYYLDPQERGHLFVARVDTASRMNLFHLPDVGKFTGDVLYISLVCSVTGSGFGKQMMALATEVAHKTGCGGIVLSSLSNSAGFYYSLGYQFISKWDGMIIDVKPWWELRPGKDGAPKLFLNSELDYQPSSGPSKPKRGRGDGSESGSETAPYEMTSDEDRSQTNDNKSDPDDDPSEDFIKDRRSKLQKMLENTLDQARMHRQLLGSLSFFTAD